MKKITLNAEKRNSIANVIETHFRNANSKLKVNWLLAKINSMTIKKQCTSWHT
jgi:hypothetical protein